MIFGKLKFAASARPKLPIFWNWTYKSIPDRQQTVVPVFENALSLHLSVYALRRLSADSDWLPQPGAHYTPQVWFVGSSTPRGISSHPIYFPSCILSILCVCACVRAWRVCERACLFPRGFVLSTLFLHPVCCTLYCMYCTVQCTQIQ